MQNNSNNTFPAAFPAFVVKLSIFHSEDLNLLSPLKCPNEKYTTCLLYSRERAVIVKGPSEYMKNTYIWDTHTWYLNIISRKFSLFRVLREKIHTVTISSINGQKVQMEFTEHITNKWCNRQKMWTERLFPYKSYFFSLSFTSSLKDFCIFLPRNNSVICTWM